MTENVLRGRILSFSLSILEVKLSALRQRASGTEIRSRDRWSPDFRLPTLDLQQGNLVAASAFSADPEYTTGVVSIRIISC
jgi:hypothetical protein